MKRKFIGLKKIIIPTLTAAILLSGCGTQNVTQQDILDMLNTTDTIELEFSVYEDMNKGYTYELEWIELGSQTSSAELRKIMEDEFGITGNTGSKNGVFYVSVDGNNTQNNTLAVALRNIEFTSIFDKTDDLDMINATIAQNYTDLDEDNEQAIYIALCDYFELLKAGSNSESNISDNISRAEAMAMVMRAQTPVDNSLMKDTEFDGAVGDNEYNLYAAVEDSNCFINTADGSLNDTTYIQSMTKAEFIYLVMNSVYGADAVQSTDSTIKLSGLANAGDLVSKCDIDGTNQAHSAILKSFVSNPGYGIDENLYKAIVLADSKGIISSVDDVDEAITKGDAMEILCKALMKNSNIEQFSAKFGRVETGYEYENNPEYIADEVIPDETDGINANGTGDIYEPTEEDLVIEDEATLAQQEAQEADEQIQAEEEVPTEAEYTVVSMDVQTMYAQQTVNLRQGPSTEYDKVGSLSTNQSVTITGYVETASGKWYQLSTEEFVSSKYLGTDKVVVQAPSNNSNTSNNNNNSNSNSNSNSNTGSNQSSSDTEGQTVSGATGDGSGSSRGNRGSVSPDGNGPSGGNLH